MPEYARRLAVVVKRTRTELDLTQEEVAEKSGTDVRTIITFEQGCGNPTLKTLYAVVRALKIDTREIFDDARKPTVLLFLSLMPWLTNAPKKKPIHCFPS